MNMKSLRKRTNPISASSSSVLSLKADMRRTDLSPPPAADGKDQVSPSFMACVLRENATLPFIKLFGPIKQLIRLFSSPRSRPAVRLYRNHFPVDKQYEASGAALAGEQLSELRFEASEGMRSKTEDKSKKKPLLPWLTKEVSLMAGAEGLEPSRTVLETAMLPLHHAPKGAIFRFAMRIITQRPIKCKHFLIPYRNCTI